jgi:hypothetical protein
MSKTKICSTCKKNKLLSEFALNKSHKDNRAADCKDCHNIYNKKHYQTNKEYYLKKSKIQKSNIKDFLHNQKLFCIRCGYDKCKQALHFHHKDKTKKEISLAMTQNKGWNLKRIQKEIDKCEILCANCHAEEHYL